MKNELVQFISMADFTRQKRVNRNFIHMCITVRRTLYYEPVSNLRWCLWSLTLLMPPCLFPTPQKEPQEKVGGYKLKSLDTKRNYYECRKIFTIRAPSSEFVSSSIPSWQISTAHARPFRGARDLAFCLKVPLDSLLVWASSEGSGETARMRRLAWTFAARIGDKYQIRLARPIQ